MSLVEILIVLTIISMIMGAAAFTGFGQLKKARIKDTIATMHLIEQAITEWQTDSSNEPCPPSLDALVQKKILKSKGEPKDGWKKPFTFKCPGEHSELVDLTSAGPDNKMGTADDLNSWEEYDDEGKKRSK